MNARARARSKQVRENTRNENSLLLTCGTLVLAALALRFALASWQYAFAQYADDAAANDVVPAVLKEHRVSFKDTFRDS